MAGTHALQTLVSSLHGDPRYESDPLTRDIRAGHLTSTPNGPRVRRAPDSPRLGTQVHSARGGPRAIAAFAPMYYRIAIAALVAGIAAIILTLVPLPDAVATRGAEPVDRQVTETYERARLLILLLNQQTASRKDVVTTSALHLRQILEA